MRITVLVYLCAFIIVYRSTLRGGSLSEKAYDIHVWGF